MTLTTCKEKVYKLTRQIPKGKWQHMDSLHDLQGVRERLER